MTKPTLVEFDLDRYLRNSKKVDLSGVDWGQVPDHPLADGDLMCAALRRASSRPGWAGVASPSRAPLTDGHAPAPSHWAKAGARED